MPQLVADDQVKLGPALQVSVELDVLLRRQKFLGQSNGPNEPDPAARLDGGHAQCRRDVRLAGACQGRNEMGSPAFLVQSGCGLEESSREPRTPLRSLRVGLLGMWGFLRGIGLVIRRQEFSPAHITI